VGKAAVSSAAVRALSPLEPRDEAVAVAAAQV